MSCTLGTLWYKVTQLGTFGTLGTLVSLSTKCTRANFDRAEHGRRVHRVSAPCTVRALCTQFELQKPPNLDLDPDQV